VALEDSQSNETLIGVNIIIPELQTGTVTNEYGFYSARFTYEIQISYLGFKTISETLELTSDLKKNYKLEEVRKV
jgi:hypothetical protein